MKAQKSNPLFRGVALYMMGAGSTQTNTNDTHKKGTRKLVKRRL